MSVDAEQPVYDVRTMEDVVERSTAQRWLNMMMVTVFAAIALPPGECRRARRRGIWGQRTASRVRNSSRLGAERGAVARLVVWREPSWQSSVGNRLPRRRVRGEGYREPSYGIRASDPPSFATAVGLLVSVALFASYMPARRAASRRSCNYAAKRVEASQGSGLRAEGWRIRASARGLRRLGERIGLQRRSQDAIPPHDRAGPEQHGRHESQNHVEPLHRGSPRTPEMDAGEPREHLVAGSDFRAGRIHRLEEIDEPCKRISVATSRVRSRPT